MTATATALEPVSTFWSPAEIARRKEVLEAFWRGEDIGRPVMVAIPWENRPWPGRPGKRDAVQAWVDNLRWRAQCPVDTLPFAGCGGGTITFSSAWGGETTHTPDGKWWIKPIIKEAKDVYALEPKAPTDGLLGPSLDAYRDLLARIDTHVPLKLPDMQGPLMTAGQLWKEDDFILAMQDHPAEVHHLLSLVTDHIIAVVQHLKATYGELRVDSYPPCWMPPRLGIGLTEDFMHLMSPRLYEEFGLPYVNRISDAFGGVWVHCCGRFKQHWKVVKKIHNLRGLDVMYPFTNPVEIYEAFPDLVHSCGVDYAEVQRNFKDKHPDAWLEFLIERTPRTIRWAFVSGCDDPATVPRQLELIKRTWGS